MSTDYDEGFCAGRDAAAKLLEATASDYDEMAKRRRDFPTGTVFGNRMEAATLADKAVLLRGQAKAIRRIK